MIALTNAIGKSRRARGFLFVLIAGALWGCGLNRSDWTNLQGKAQGTTFTITYRDSLGHDLSAPVDSLFRLIDRSLSLWDSTSTIVRFNAAADSFSTDDRHFQVVLALSRQQWNSTDGAFDPTVLPLVRAWGLGKQGRAELDTAAVDSLMRCVGMPRIRIPDSWEGHGGPLVFRKSDACVQFDPNGIAQGYTVDMLALLLRLRGIERYMVEVGGEVRTSGANERGGPWTIQIDKPVEGDAHKQQTVVPLRDRSLATSGNYRKFIEIGGMRYGHTIDPRSGRPAMSALLSASVVADDCATADALGTALMVMGPDAAKAWLAAHREVEGYLISDDGMGGYAVWMTEGWPE
ncbi:MAG: FAD:protein FMN transferase [Flavobacteriales bacterium]|nr:FAD:protein FMN transferase [Flavobacteriales bacterium]